MFLTKDVLVDHHTDLRGQIQKAFARLSRHSKSLAWSLFLKTKDGYKRHDDILLPVRMHHSMLLEVTTRTLFAHTRTDVP